jgi:hypothetical protein
MKLTILKIEKLPNNAARITTVELGIVRVDFSQFDGIGFKLCSNSTAT